MHPSLSVQVTAPAPAPQRRWGRRVAIGLVLTLTLCGVTVGALWHLTDLFSPERRVLKAVSETLARQRNSLLSGDEAGYLAVLDAQAAQADRERLTLQFRSLRAMKVAAWSDRTETLEPAHGGLWKITLVSSPCFVVDSCARAQAEAVTVWRITGREATLLKWAPGEERPHPWQVSELVSLSGKRTVVATVKAREAILASLLAAAEKAALVADRFAREGAPPERYVVYWAPAAEWRIWFDRDPAEWVGGVAVPSSAERYELILNSDDLDPDEVDSLLRHELTHASSLPGRVTGGKEVWWLMEGLAQLAEMEGTLVSAHEGLGEVARVMKSTANARLDIPEPPVGASHAEVTGHYAAAFLGVRCIAERYGEPALVEYFHAVMHGRRSAAAGADEVLGVQWPDLERECLDYIRQVAG